MKTNPQLELAYEYVRHTDKNIFLTGKAGTGKTTFLHRIQKEVIKRMAVVAPTGVAAINAGGMTIHSLFQLPFGPIVPGARIDPRQHRFSKKKISLIRSLDLLVIDEISMVRADVLDGIDGVLRRIRRSNRPFGGVQLLMIGDLNQLPPVVKHEEWNLLSPHYQTMYFFGSRELQRTDPVTIELTHIYRQSDEKFIHLLNKVRDNVMDEKVLGALNSRFRENFEPSEKDGYITLTSHNATAQNINQERLTALNNISKKFKARIDGEFPAHAFPTDEELELKIGAQVMFVKNDPNPEKLYFNGKIGRIVRFGDDAIYIQCPDDAEEIGVTRLEWNNTRYQLNEKTKEVESDVLGTFTQYPLKLAWAITIHKSQGLTFDRAIIDAEAAFAHGQVYVALSRCRSFEGIVLRSKISFSSVKTDTVVKNYNSEAEKNRPTEETLETSKREYQKKLLLELFDFSEMKKAIGFFNRILFEQGNAIQGSAFDQLNQFYEKAEEKVFSIAQKFEPQLIGYLNQNIKAEENEVLQKRVKKASVYFSDNMEKELRPILNSISILSDNQAAKKKAFEKLEELKTIFQIKSTCFKLCQKGFSAAEYVRTKANADIDYAAQQKKRGGDKSSLTSEIKNEKLFIQLKEWREKIAEKENLRAHDVIHLRSIMELTRHLPTSTASLKKMHGIGEVKIKHYGGQILNIIDEYVQKNKIPTSQLNLIPTGKTTKPDSKQVTYDLYRSGKTIAEIATERDLAESTIEGHLSHYIKIGELEIEEFLSKNKIEELVSFFEKAESLSSTPAKEFFGDKYSYGEIRMVRGYMEGK